MRKLFLIVALITLPAAIFAQKVDTSGKAIVYFYANRTQTTPGQVRKPVFMDGIEIADIRPARYFIAVIEPGKHSFHMKKKRFGGVETNFAAGKTYYIRLNWGRATKIQGVDMPPPEIWSFEIKQLKPIDPANIANKEIVFLSLE